MKPKTFLLSLLIFPYLCWVIATPLSVMSPNLNNNSPVLGFVFGTLVVSSLIYSPSIVFWGIPYTVMVIGLLLWSRNKSSKTIYRILFFSPFLLAALTIFQFLIVFVVLSITPTIHAPLLEDYANLVLYSLFAALPILVFGYIFVGLGVGAHKILENIGFIRQGTDTTQQLLPPVEEL